jgi:hypothetical protein
VVDRGTGERGQDAGRDFDGAGRVETGLQADPRGVRTRKRGAAIAGTRGILA